MMYLAATKKRAFALSIVLWIVAALMLGAVSIAHFAKDSVKLTQGVNDKLKTRIITQDIFEILKFYLLTASNDSNSLRSAKQINFIYKVPRRIIVDGRDYNLSKNIKISIQDTSMLLNVFHLSPTIVAKIATTNNQTQLRNIIKDSLKDWLDKDNFVSLNGAEASRYVNYPIRNEPTVQNVAELRLIKGIHTLPLSHWNHLKHRFYYGRASTLNLALVDETMLSAFLDIDMDYAKELVNIRKNNMNEYIRLVSSLAEKKKYDRSEYGFHLSKQYKIKIIVELGDVRTILKALVDFKGRKNKVYTIINYSVL